MLTPEQLVENVRAYRPQVDAARIQEAYEFSKQSLKGIYRLSGDSMLNHAMAVVENLLAFKPDENSIIAAFLHNLPNKTPDFDLENIRNKFGDDVAVMLEGIAKLQKVHLKGNNGDMETFRRMVLSVAKDLRIILIRLADLLHDMETLDYVQPLRRKEIAREVLEVYSPIASRLGIYNIKCVLEDIAFRYLYSEQYADLKNQLADFIRRQEKIIELVKVELVKFLKQQGIQGRVEGRLKNLYSIYRKLKRKSRASLREIFDIFAFRIILPTQMNSYGVENTENLYTLLGLIHSHWTPVENRFKDYIAVPKPNGYQSIHTTVTGFMGKTLIQPFEIQIRSEKMHREAEFGLASHWLYEDTRGASSRVRAIDDNTEQTGEMSEMNLDRYKDWMEGLSQLQQNFDRGKELIRPVQVDIFKDHIYVFTPTSEVKDLPLGSTPVDFAYAVHTDIGHRCQGAKVNGAIVPLDYQLKNGDIVEILTKNKIDPKPHWLSFVKSSQAKNKIKSFFKGLDKDLSFREGKELINKYLGSMGLPLLDDNLTIFRWYDSQRLSLKERVSLVEDIGNGSVNVIALLKKVLGTKRGSEDNGVNGEVKTKIRQQPRAPQEKSDSILIAGESGVPYKISSCCKPQSGDPIVGYVTRGNAIRIHLETCKFLKNGDQARTLQAQWGLRVLQQRRMPVKVHLRVVDRMGLIRDIADVVASFNVNIFNFSFKDRKDNLINCELFLEVSDQQQFQKIIQRLTRIRNVIDVQAMN
jgi:GTP pyrophosphokinase